MERIYPVIDGKVQDEAKQASLLIQNKELSQ